MAPPPTNSKGNFVNIKPADGPTDTSQGVGQNYVKPPKRVDINDIKAPPIKYIGKGQASDFKRMSNMYAGVWKKHNPGKSIGKHEKAVIQRRILKMYVKHFSSRTRIHELGSSNYLPQYTSQTQFTGSPGQNFIAVNQNKEGNTYTKSEPNKGYWNLDHSKYVRTFHHSLGGTNIKFREQDKARYTFISDWSSLIGTKSASKSSDDFTKNNDKIMKYLAPEGWGVNLVDRLSYSDWHSDNKSLGYDENSSKKYIFNPKNRNFEWDTTSYEIGSGSLFTGKSSLFDHMFDSPADSLRYSGGH